jgi:hypothetical protein
MNEICNSAPLKRFVDEVWARSIVPALCEYVRIPNKSPLFDPQWERIRQAAHGRGGAGDRAARRTVKKAPA